MSLAHALLTSLSEQPASGYDLARRFDKSIGFYWHATHQQIYRELARMLEKKWISQKTVPQDTRPTKNIYTILEAGRRELKRWALEESIPIELREDLFIKLRADAACGPLGLQKELERRLELHSNRLAYYLETAKSDFPKPEKLSREARLQHLTLRAGIIFEKGNVAWCKEALAVLKDVDSA